MLFNFYSSFENPNTCELKNSLCSVKLFVIRQLTIQTKRQKNHLLAKSNLFHNLKDPSC